MTLPWTPDEWLMVIFSGTAILMWLLAGLVYWIRDLIGHPIGDSMGTIGCAWLATSFVFVLASLMVWVKS